jgi:hypothetical protein
VLLFKIALAPVLILAVTLAGRRWGPSVAGWLLGLPLTSFPVLLFLSIEQGSQFASHAARGSLLGLLAWATFNVIYAYACLRLNWWQSTLIGWAAYFAVAAMLLPVTMTAVWAYVVVIITLAVILIAFPRVSHSQTSSTLGKYDLWVRMASASAMVFLITSIAEALGPTASGLFTTFPTYSTILAVFSHREEEAAAVNILKGVTAGLYTSATFFLAVCIGLLHWHPALSFTVALSSAAPVQAASLLYLRRNERS